MELSIESSCQYVKWKVRDFFQLPSEVGYCLDSPEFSLSGDNYRLQLYPNWSQKDQNADDIELKLKRVTCTFPERSVSYKIGFRVRGTDSEVDEYYVLNQNQTLLTPRMEVRDIYAPDGTLIVLCSMLLKEQSSVGSQQSEKAKTSDTKEEQKGLPGQSVFFSSCSWSFNMELSIESPCQNVTWKVPCFWQLLSKIGNSLNSPEFSFAGGRFCLRFYPKGNNNGDTVDTDLQLVKLTSTFPERIVLYKVGYKGRYTNDLEYDHYIYSGTLIDDFGFCVSRSQLEEKKHAFVADGTLTVLCSMCVKEQSNAGSPQSDAAGNSRSEVKQERLAGKEIEHYIDKTAVLDNVSCAVQTEDASSINDKENPEDTEWPSLDTKDDVLLRERMKELLIKGSDHDVTICVQDKEFRAHRSILSTRSPVFAMMLSHDTKENNSSNISIEDCDPESFDEFLLYVYSGRTENLTASNALQLYYTADKYDFPMLKERCVNLLKTSLTVSSICDVVLLAAKHQEKELLEVAMEFFARNIKKIIVTVGWQKFMSQNPVEANELYVKSLEILLPEN